MKAAIRLLERAEILTFHRGNKDTVEIRNAIVFLQAAEKIDKQKSIAALDGCFLFLANHGWNTPDPDIVAVMNLLAALPGKSGVKK